MLDCVLFTTIRRLQRESRAGETSSVSRFRPIANVTPAVSEHNSSMAALHGSHSFVQRLALGLPRCVYFPLFVVDDVIASEMLFGETGYS